MKNYINTFFYLSILILFFSCVPDNEKFNGTPEDNNLSIETVIGSISTPVTFALPGQLVDFTVTLPQDFVSKVNTKLTVEAVTTTTGMSIRKGYVTLNPGQNSGSGKILVGGGGGTFSMPVSLKLNAVSLETAFPGKQFLLTSEKVIVDSGDTSVPDDSDNKFQIKVAWESTSSGNPMTCSISRDNSTALTLKGNNWTSVKYIKISGTDYPIVFNTDLNTTAFNFKNLQGPIIQADKGIEVKSSGKALLFNFGVAGIQEILMSPFSATVPPPPSPFGVFFSGGNFITGTNLKSKSYQILNSQLTSTSSSETVETGFNEGTYIVSIIPSGVIEATTTNLRYRIIVKLPSGLVNIYNGVFNNITSTSPKKDIFKFTKTGLGQNADYGNFLQL
jgi:hypothetical protein